MAEDVLDITAAAAKRLYSGFQIAYRETKEGKNLEEMHPLAPLQLFNEVAEDDEVVASRVDINTRSGLCPRTGAQLRLLRLTAEHKQQLKNSMYNIASARQARRADFSQQLRNFETWLG